MNLFSKLYVRQIIFWLAVSLFSVFFCVMAMFFVAEKIYESDSFFIEASGTKSRVEQIVLFKEAMRHELRAFRFSKKAEDATWAPVKKLYGNMRGMYRDGTLEYTYYENENAKVARGKLINVCVNNNLIDVARKIESLSHSPAEFHVYQNGQVLVWLRDHPFNLLLIRAGLASPHPNPPTNVVDRLFAEYYWSLLD